MIALDTNVLVRFLVADDAAQARKAKALVESLSEDARAYVPDIVVCELVWVLTRSYGFDRTRVSQALRLLASARQLRLHSADNVLRAIAAFEQGSGDFADYLIRDQAKAAGCKSVLTFDKKLLKEASFASP